MGKGKEINKPHNQNVYDLQSPLQWEIFLELIKVLLSNDNDNKRRQYRADGTLSR